MLLTLLRVFVQSLAYRVSYAAVTTDASPRIPSRTLLVDMTATCQEIESSVSDASSIFFFGTEQYDADISHYSTSSTQEAACSFQPGIPEDVGIALQILGRNNCPFAVKCGGHASNPGFSSTPGVQIVMERFSDVIYDNVTQTAKIGAGLIWDSVYSALEPYGVNIAGARVSGIGVAGFTLGGGYSWHANQYGLSIDTVEAFELVLPNGTVTNVDASQEDLFFALKGGLNNFGIVTQFTFKTFPQTQVWGGSIIYFSSDVGQMTQAIAKFSATNTDPKANILASYVYFQVADAIDLGANEVILFYDAPSPPPGLFDDFLTPDNAAQVCTRSFLSLVQSSFAQWEGGYRMAVTTLSIPGYSEDFLQRMLNETMYWGANLPLGFGYVAYSAEPFLPSIYHIGHRTPTAWPGSRAFFTPLHIQYAWTGSGSTDDIMINALKQSAAYLWEYADVTDDASLYPNYAISDTPLEAMYGNNVARLRHIAREVDPNNVMGLAGGFKFNTLHSE